VLKSTRLWGHDASSLHDAAWRARGVHCVRAGVDEVPDASKYLVLPPGRLVWFGSVPHAESSEIRVIDARVEPPRDRVVHDGEGLVTGVERHSSPPLSCRVVMTADRHASPSVQRHVAGTVVEVGDAAGERRLIDQLVRTWSRPDLVIDGIEQSQDGVWHARGRTLPGDVVLVGPLWLGDTDTLAGRTCLVGPDWVADHG
jgi:hypothetical protein